ncbi:p21-C-terminal region-binding protein-domain-containing protein [Pisolithus albus]|nr:p21-C-terminal region-binding protein-domain-containing protein [Pisolithus albus]
MAYKQEVLAHLVWSAADSGVGSTIKTDGEESDPFSQPSLMGGANTEDSPALLEYMLSKTSADLSFHSALSPFLPPKHRFKISRKPHVGLVLCESLINMPVQMYRMLVGEIRDVVADGDPYNFIRYLFISGVYRLTHEEEAMVAAQCNSKRYKLAGTSALGGDGDDLSTHDLFTLEPNRL